MLTRSHAAFDELRQGVKDIEFLADPTQAKYGSGTPHPSPRASSRPSLTDSPDNTRVVTFRVIGEGANQGAQRQNLKERIVDLLIFRKVATVVDDETSFEFLFESPYVVAAGASNPWVRHHQIRLPN